MHASVKRRWHSAISEASLLSSGATLVGKKAKFKKWIGINPLFQNKEKEEIWTIDDNNNSNNSVHWVDIPVYRELSWGILSSSLKQAPWWIFEEAPPNWVHCFVPVLVWTLFPSLFNVPGGRVLQGLWPEHIFYHFLFFFFPFFCQ